MSIYEKIEAHRIWLCQIKSKSGKTTNFLNENYQSFSTRILTGYYPQSVHVDRIYRTKENRAWCKERGIRISGPPLGRPPKNVSKETKKIAHEDEIIRNSIEGKFGQAKRRYSLDRVMSKLPHTSETAISITFLVMNLSAILRQIFCLFYYYLKKSDLFAIVYL